MKKNKILSFILVFTLFIPCLFFMTACGKEENKNNSATDNNQTITENLNIEIKNWDNLPKRAKAKISSVESNSNEGKEIISKLDKTKYDTSKEVYLYDISILNGDTKLQPEHEVKVIIDNPNKEITDYVVFHIKEDNSIEQLMYTIAGNKLSFNTSSFSYFAFATKLRGLPTLTVKLNNAVEESKKDILAEKIDFYANKDIIGKYYGGMDTFVDGERFSNKRGMFPNGIDEISLTFEKNTYDIFNVENNTFNGIITVSDDYYLFAKNSATDEFVKLESNQNAQNYSIGEYAIAKKNKFDEIWNNTPTEQQSNSNILMRLFELVQPRYDLPEGAKEPIIIPPDDITLMYFINIRLEFSDFEVRGLHYIVKDGHLFNVQNRNKPLDCFTTDADNGAFLEHSSGVNFLGNLTIYDGVFLNAHASEGKAICMRNMLLNNDGSIDLVFSGYEAHIVNDRPATSKDEVYKSFSRIKELTPNAKYIQNNVMIDIGYSTYEYVEYNINRLFYYFEIVFQETSYPCAVCIDLPYKEMDKSEEFNNNRKTDTAPYNSSDFGITPEILALHQKYFIDECSLPTYTHPVN